MSAPFRLSEGGDIDRGRELAFRFNRRDYVGHPGDTLASALLANGIMLVARSVKYHRPRGIVAAGADEPNALVQLGRGRRAIPNLKATEIELFDGLEASSVNVFPSLGFDVGAAIGWLSRFMPAGFYYKTFFASPFLWNRVFEPVIRRAGGWGRVPEGEDPDFYDRRYAHCEVLVVGGGPAGIMAALAAAAGGARVILADEGGALGGTLRHRRVRVDGGPPDNWIAQCGDALAGNERVRLLTRTTVTGCFDDNYAVALERRADEGTRSTPARPRQRLWHIRAREIVFATGAHERPLVFANNDRPGVMLASAVQAYVNRFAVLPGRRLVLFTNNDRAYETALDFQAAGGRVAAIVDSRARPAGPLPAGARESGIEILAGHAVSDTRGRQRIERVIVAPLVDGRADIRRSRAVRADVLAVSGGFNPAVHLHSHVQGKLDWDETAACFRPARAQRALQSAGACNGTFALAEALAEGRAAGLGAAEASGFGGEVPPAPAVEEFDAGSPQPLWCVYGDDGRPSGKHFVDLQNDTSAADIAVAVQEGFESVEHMKRYTLTGFGTDQGKLSNVNGLAILAELTNRAIPEVGTTTFRPPYSPLTFAAMGGRDRGELFDPARLTSIHDQHVGLGAAFEDVGQWKRPWYYPRGGEDMAAAVARECAAVRNSVGILDASTLGKIDIQGPDSAEFLHRVYTNAWLKLPVGRVRYGIMCREDGMVFDDGTTARIDEHRYLMTTTTGNALAVLDHLEDYLQTEWRDLCVRLTSVTEQWATIAIAGPRSRDVLGKLVDGMDLSADGFPFMSFSDTVVAGIAARIFRISFTGELQYEINVPWHAGPALWDALMEAGAEYEITPYGTETMHVLRAEKGFIIVGQETDGTQTPHDLGLDWIVADKPDFIGKRSLRRVDTMRPDRKQLVGLRPLDPKQFVPEGSQLVEAGTGSRAPVPMVGFVTSSYWSPSLDTHFCLALIERGRERHGDVVDAGLETGAVPMTVCEPVFYDPGNRRRDGD